MNVRFTFFCFSEVEDLSCEKVTLVYHSFMRGDGILFELLVFVEAAAERAAVEWSQVVTVIGKERMDTTFSFLSFSFFVKYLLRNVF